MAYRFVPVYTPNNSQGIDYGKVDTDIMYNNVMNEFAREHGASGSILLTKPTVD